MNKILKNKGFTSTLSSTKVSGFTLIEILVVIGIIAILAAIVLIAINPARQFRQANNSQRTANVNVILNAIGQYVVDNKGDIAGLNIAGAGEEFDEDMCDELVPKYIPAIPTDPDSTTEGGTIAVCTDVDAGDVEYEVDVDAAGRVTVSAPLAVNVDTGAVDPNLISVTR